jgi:hypothetical protein
MGLKTSITKTTRQDKFKRLAGALAVNIAKKKNDPDVKKLLKYKKLYFQFKEKINKKYKATATREARKSMT